VEGKPRRRRAGGGAKGLLNSMADRLLFILIYEKTNPLQTMHGLQFGLSQPQTNYWIHQVLAVLQQALADLGMSPPREAGCVAASPLALEGTSALAIDGSERRRQRPKDEELQKGHYSGKKKTHTDKNLLLVNEDTGKVAYLSPTGPGKTHDKKRRPTRLRSVIRATPRSIKTRAFKATSRKGSSPGNQKKTQRQAIEYR
jgi:hypothetical protein